MKKIVSILLLAALVLSLMAPVLANAGSLGLIETAWVKTGNGKSLNVREEPSKNAKILGGLKYRTKVNVYEYRGGWALVEPADRSWSNPQWVSKSFLVYSDPGKYKPNPKPTTKPTSSPEDAFAALDKVCKKIEYLNTPYSAVIRTSRPTNLVHLRWYPDTSARFIEQYLCDTEILVLAQGGKWAQVQIVEDGYVGFILLDNVSPLAE